MKWIVLFAGIGAIITAVWLYSGVFITDRMGDVQAGTFGDMFGAVNALFSGWAFAGVIVAILMQMEELKLQRQELTGSRKAQEAQVQALVIAAQISGTTTRLSNPLSNQVSDDLLRELANLQQELNDMRKSNGN